MKEGKVKGFNDYIGDSARKRSRIGKIIQKQFELYGFEPAETPTIEFEEFVKGENVNDEAVSDIFKLSDKGKRELALRYEFTFQLKRISQNQKLPYKRYQIGSVFRDEPVSSNRFREFTQCDADIIGSSAKDEAELLSIVKKILEEVNVDYSIYVNNRKLLNEIMVSEDIEEKKRLQILRELDKMDKLSKKEVADNLKKLGAEKLMKIFDKSEKDFEKYKFYSEIKELKKLCKAYGVKLEFQPTLTRGLSYYNGTIFEVKSKKDKGTICGGGAYLVGDIQSCGFAFGLDRLSMLADIEGEGPEIQIISLNKDKESIDLAEKLRSEGIRTNLILDKSVGKAMDYANSKDIKKVIFVGEKEVKSKKFKVKDMSSGEEKMMSSEELIKNHQG